MREPIVVSRDAWLRARKDFLAREKELARLRDDSTPTRPTGAAWRR